MNKITEDSVKAFKAQKEMKSGKTQVTRAGDGSMVYLLHGNQIASFKEGLLELSDGGYQSTTTKERLNGILEFYGAALRIRQVDGKWFLGQIPWEGHVRLTVVERPFKQLPLGAA